MQQPVPVLQEGHNTPSKIKYLTIHKRGEKAKEMVYCYKVKHGETTIGKVHSINPIGNEMSHLSEPDVCRMVSIEERETRQKRLGLVVV